MAFDSNGDYYNPVDPTCKHLPKEYQTCGNCLEFSPKNPVTVGLCGVMTRAGLRESTDPCGIQNPDGTPAFVALESLTVGWVYPPRRKLIPYSRNTEL